METTFFFLGILSVIGIALLVLIGWNSIKTLQLLKAIKQHEEYIRDNHRNMWEVTHDMREDLERKINNQERSVSIELERVYNEIHTNMCKKQILKG